MSELALAQQIAREIVSQHTEPVLRFSLEERKPELFDSKVGGTPYLPHEMSWPLDSRGQSMELLAQIDCAALKGLPDFPHTGLLQFFFALDDVFGANFDDPITQKDFRVLYHETVDRSVTAEEVLRKKAPQPEDGEDYTPLYGVFSIRFEKPKLQHLTEYDYRAWAEFLRRWNESHGTDFQNQWDYYRATKITDVFPELEDDGPCHQLGGYPYFTQQDPRDRLDLAGLDVLLFQLDSEGKGADDLVLWGDCGVANFFISRDALKRRDFSRVCYNWDCT